MRAEDREAIYRLVEAVGSLEAKMDIYSKAIDEHMKANLCVSCNPTKNLKILYAGMGIIAFCSFVDLETALKLIGIIKDIL